MTLDEEERLRAAQIDVETALLKKEHAGRPSTLYDPELTHQPGTERPWVAIKGHAVARGTTPENAMKNFDILWAAGKINY